MKSLKQSRLPSLFCQLQVIGRRFIALSAVGLLLVFIILVLASCGGRSAVPVPTESTGPNATPPLASATSDVPPPTDASPTEIAVPTEIQQPAETPGSPTPTETGVEVASATVQPTGTEMPPAPTTPAATRVPPARMPSPGYGMQAFLWWRPEVAQRDLEMIRDAGFGWVKQAFAWREIEGKGKGQFDWSISDRVVQQVEDVGGLRLIVRLDSDPSWASGVSYPNPEGIIMSPPNDLEDYADFCYAVAKRYKGRIAAYQIWNEPNLSREWGGRPPNASAYVGMLKAGYQAIKRADPAAIVISAGLAPTTRFDQVAMPDTEYVQRMYNNGARPYFDALGAHGAGYKAPPGKAPGEVANDANYYNVGDPNCPGRPCRIYCFRHVEDLRQVMVDNGDAEKQVVVLEFGWTMDPRTNSPYHWHAVTEEQQADYFVRAYQYAKANWSGWIGVMSLIYMPNIDWTENDEQYWWSIAIPNYPQFYPYKSYRDLAAMPK